MVVTTRVLMVMTDHLLHLALERVERVGAFVMVSAHLTVFGDALGGALGRWRVLVVMVNFGLVCRVEVLVAHVSLMVLVVQVADGLAGV